MLTETGFLAARRSRPPIVCRTRVRKAIAVDGDCDGHRGIAAGTGCDRRNAGDWLLIRRAAIEKAHPIIAVRGKPFLPVEVDEWMKGQVSVTVCDRSVV